MMGCSGLENYDKHLQGQEHKQEILSIEERQNDLPDKSVASSNLNCDGALKCHACDLLFNTLENFQKHSETREHALKIILKQVASNGSSNPNTTITNYELNTNKESILPELNKPPEISYGQCEVCSKMFSGPEPYKQHLDSQAHKRKVALQNSVYAGGNGTFKCEPCSKSFSGEVPFAQHMSSETHRRKLHNIQIIESFRRENSSQIKENVVEKEDLINVYLCNICNIQCSGWIPYQQHLSGSTHLKNEKKIQSINGIMAQLQISKVSEASENITQIMNGSYEKDNRKSENDSVLPEKVNELKVVSDDELGELIKIIPPDEDIKFDHLDQPEESNEICSTIKKNENGFNDSLKETEEKNKHEVYETCKLCNVSFLDKESAKEHFESREHFERRWGS